MLRLGLVSASVLCALVSGPANADEGSGDIVLGERQKIAVVIVAPAGQIANATSSGIYRLVGEVLERHTDLHVEPFDSEIVGDCKSSIACIVTRIRDNDPAHPKLVAIVSIRWIDEHTDNIGVVLVDSDVALASADSSAEDYEAVVFSRAVVGRAAPVSVKSEHEMETMLARIFEEDFRPALMASKNWDPYGQIEIVSQSTGAAIQLDGNLVGVTRPGTTRILRVKRGDRKLVLAHPGLTPWSRIVRVDSGETSRAEAILVPAPHDRSIPSHVVLWSGAAMSAIGAAVLIYGIQQAATAGYGTVCFEAGDQRFNSCSTSGYVRFGQKNPPETVPMNVSANGKGVPIVPLGFAMLLSGAVWLIGALIGEDDIPTLLTVGGGALAGFGLFLVFEETAPRDAVGAFSR